MAALLFHHVGPAQRGIPPSLTVSPSQFERFVDHLVRARMATIGLDELAAWMEQGTPLPARPVLITFDDGYADLGVHAFPALRGRGLRAVVFVPSALIGKGNEWDRPASGDAVDADTPRLLSADEIRRWSDDGIDFAAHGRAHRDLCLLDGPELDEELATSREEVEAVLGRPVAAMAYPYGTHNAAVRRAVGGHYRLAFGTTEGVVRRSADPLALKRTMVHPGDTIVDVALRCRLGFSPLHRAKAGASAFVRSRA